MQVVDVLGDDCHFEVFFQLCDYTVGLIRLFVLDIPPPGVVEVQDQAGVAVPALD